MRHLRRDAVRDDLVHRNHQDVVRHLVVICKDRNLEVVNLVHLVLVVERLGQDVDQDVADVQQNLDELNLDAVLTLVRVDQQVSVVLDHLKFQMDYFPDAVGQDAVVQVLKMMVLQMAAVLMVLVPQKFQMDYFLLLQQVVEVESELQQVELKGVETKLVKES
jgi:hypothetical protein